MLKLNLQHFAEAGTLVNATGNYVNTYDSTQVAFEGANTLTPTMKTYYDTELLENARAELVHTQFGKKQPLPAHRGKTVEWRKWNTLEDAAALTEGVIPTGQKLGQSSINVPVAQYGTYVTVSDQLELHAVDDVILGAAEELGASAGSTMDKIARNVLISGTNVIYADKISSDGTATEVTSRDDLDESAKLTPAVINKAVTYLKKMKAPKIDGKYMAIIHPSVAYDLRQSDEWIEAHKYASPEEIYNGEIGELHGVRFIETTEAKIVEVAGDGSSKAVYLSLFFGKDAYGEIDPDGGGMEMIIKDKSEAGGPLNQFSTLGYKFSTAFKILYEDRMVRVESCSSYSGSDSTN
ncbi:MAG: N4-gp56 family major capsid protein [Clostridiales bacterium]|nr:N4-gp56 family major capsid protein [Clostridiales bacterium]